MNSKLTFGALGLVIGLVVGTAVSGQAHMDTWGLEMEMEADKAKRELRDLREQMEMLQMELETRRRPC